MVELIEKQKQQKPNVANDKSFNGAKLLPKAVSDVDGEAADSIADCNVKLFPNEILVLEQDSVNNESDGGLSARTITAGN